MKIIAHCACAFSAAFLVLAGGIFYPTRSWSDTVAWEDGATWQNVRITSFRTTDGKPQFHIEPTGASVPANLKPGWYSGVRRAEFSPVGLISTSSPTVQANPGTPYPAIETTILSVVQGDTLRLDTGQRLRLLGVDSPETTDPNRPLEFFGREAFLYTKRQVEGKHVRIEFDQRRVDNAGQLLGYVYLPDGRF